MYSVGGDTYSFAVNYPHGLIEETQAALKAYLAEHPEEFVYPLATPIHYSISPRNRTTLLGSNCIFSKSNGNIERSDFTNN